MRLGRIPKNMRQGLISELKSSQRVVWHRLAVAKVANSPVAYVSERHGFRARWLQLAHRDVSAIYGIFIRRDVRAVAGAEIQNPKARRVRTRYHKIARAHHEGVNFISFFIKIAVFDLLLRRVVVCGIYNRRQNKRAKGCEYKCRAKRDLAPKRHASRRVSYSLAICFCLTCPSFALLLRALVL